MSALTIAIPTYQREQILLETIKHVLRVAPTGSEFLVVDQTPQHERPVAEALAEWDRAGHIRWIKLAKPSITGAMNKALIEASEEIVLFLDDDIVPEPELISAHIVAHERGLADLIAGRVIQPWQEGQDFTEAVDFHFATLHPRYIEKFIGCNFSVKRSTALALGGFDENFVKVAYNYELEFAHRVLSTGKRIYFEPAALVHHLKVSAGGTRSYGEHLTTAKPDHAVGAYYYILRTCSGVARIRALAIRFLRSIVTKHHMKKPWTIFHTLVAEIRGISWALRLAGEGPRLIRSFHD